MPFAMAKGPPEFKLKYTLEQRKAEAAHIIEKYPNRVPVIVEKANRSDVPNITNKKFLVPNDSTVGQLVFVIRKRLKLSAEKAIFVFVKDALPSTAALLSAVYAENKDEDGFLYVTYSGENTFGFCKYNFKAVNSHPPCLSQTIYPMSMSIRSNKWIRK